MTWMTQCHAGDPEHLGRNFKTIAHHARTSLLVGGGESRAMHRILLAYNGSERAAPALGWAVRLQRSLSDEVLLVAVEENPATESDWYARIEAGLAAGGLHGRLRRRHGQPADEILAAATEHDADLIVMGSYRHSALPSWLIGSLPDQILSRTRLPVLVAEAPSHPEDQSDTRPASQEMGHGKV
jgi:nucleotide-binding universal stress UspA family protein